ncbi:MAG: AmmeMemoRadiSam system radical SAM enzyme [Candidatus Marinimicrobia bacterium]|nr:AmmeMemoRadiSam system radical SAM enzyme [Candidatus Neomarinimicrobiota bacterium]
MQKVQLAKFWEQKESGLHCYLCPHDCVLKNGQTGLCGVRKNEGNKLLSLNYARPAAMSVDPMEKKPLYHFLPGTSVFSIGTSGCNLSCKFCQNWELSKESSVSDYELVSPEKIIRIAQDKNCSSIAFTYNEPIIFAEYVMAIAELAKNKGMNTVMVSNGYVSPQVIPELFKNIDAVNIDLKGMDDTFYRKFTGGRLEPVLETLIQLKKMNVHTEITTLLIDGENTDEAMLKKEFDWIVNELSSATPLHLSAFFPAYKMLDYSATLTETIKFAQKLAYDSGLAYVYLGNVTGVNNDSNCSKCNKTLIRRGGYVTEIVHQGICSCGHDNNIIVN